MKWSNLHFIQLYPYHCDQNHRTQKSIRHRWIRLCLVVCTLNLTSACTTKPLTPSDSHDQIQQWIKHKHYSKAYQALLSKQMTKQMTPTSLSHLQSQSKSYWKETYQQVQLLKQKQQWRQAKQLLSTAIRDLIDPSPAKAELQLILNKENANLYKLRVNEAIARGQWLNQNYKLQLALQNSTQASALSRINTEQLEYKQQALAFNLLQYAQSAIEKKDFYQSKRCYDTLNLILTPPELKPQLEIIGRTLSQRKKKNLTNRQNTLIARLDKSIASGQLVKATQQIAELKKLQPLPQNAIIKIEAINSVLAYNSVFLDEKAETYYRDGNVELASSIWEYLLKLAPNNTDIKLKLSRAEKVIKNMQELRESGHRAAE